MQAIFADYPTRLPEDSGLHLILHSIPCDRCIQAAMHSRKFTPAQFNYSTTDKELLAVIDALCTFGRLLLGTRFTIRTDHMALQTLMRQMTPNERQIRRLEAIKVFNFDIEHIEGKDDILADAVSRVYEMPTDDDDISEQDYVEQDRGFGDKRTRKSTSRRLDKTRQQQHIFHINRH